MKSTPGGFGNDVSHSMPPSALAMNPSALVAALTMILRVDSLMQRRSAVGQPQNPDVSVKLAAFVDHDIAARRPGRIPHIYTRFDRRADHSHRAGGRVDPPQVPSAVA